jgi:fluoroquinolone transport system permease protein
VNHVTVLLRKDMRVIYRDRFLLVLLSYPLLIALGMRWAAPWIPFEGAALYLAPAAVMAASAMLGMVLAFSLIEEREQQTWLLLRVLPLSQRRLFGYLISTCAGLAFISSLGAAALYGQPIQLVPDFLLMAAVSALTAPLLMLLTSSLASNKIEGMAVSKTLNGALSGVILIFLLPAGWHWALAWNPYYWIYIGLLRAYAGEEAIAGLAINWPNYPGWLCAAVSLVLCSAGIAFSARLYRRRVR